ncbi:MAG: 6-phosphogluconolactonase, partial [Planctomycetes bacterium]|nr:6-phosphogluconolactonase [Planctomycetota bacterium]
FRALDAELHAGRIASTDFVGTHLDEYIAFEPDRRGGMVHELMLRCPALRDMLARGSFLPVPCHGAEGSMRAHEERIERAGGIKLQLLGIGRNGHVAFNEPGASFEEGFHVTTLAESTRADAKPRFVPDEPPRRAVTAGMKSILGADRIVLCAFGRGKADAVRAMLRDEVSNSCPASALRNHKNVLVLLDPEAASSLDATAGAAG